MYWVSTYPEQSYTIATNKIVFAVFYIWIPLQISSTFFRESLEDLSKISDQSESLEEIEVEENEQEIIEEDIDEVYINQLIINDS